MLATGYWLLATGHWLLATGYWLLVAGCWPLATGYWLLATGHWLLVAGCWPLATGYWPMNFKYTVLNTQYSILNTQYSILNRMIKHIVMIRLRETEKRKANAIRLKEAIEGLMGKIPELLTMEVGLNVNTKASAYDLVLTSGFESLEALDAYRVHPEHKKVLELLYEVMEQTAVVDYEL